MFQDTHPAQLDDQRTIDPWAEFRVTHRGEVMGLLKRVSDGGIPVVLASPDGASVSCLLWAVDPHQGRLTFSAEAASPQLQRVVDSSEAVAVAYLESVKLQFDVDALMLVRSAASIALRGSMPGELYRFQRRGSYRVRPAAASAPTVSLRHPSIPDMLVTLRILDLSVGGCALLWDADVPEIRPGVLLNHVRVQLGGETDFGCALLIHHIASINSSEGGHRIGCEWRGLSAPAEQALQRYVDQTQRRRRLLALW
jgi:c-di-GMP-binding flagellar brake protein YcgR